MRHLIFWPLIALLLVGCIAPPPQNQLSTSVQDSPLPTAVATQTLPEAIVPPSMEPVALPVLRDVDPAVDADALAQLTAGNQAFAFDLYHALDKGDENLVFSPYSITTAFSMVYAGARNETAKQMATTLHYTQPIATHHAAFNALDQRLNAQNGDDGFQLETTNGMWLQRNFPFLPSYLETVAANYALSLWLADFIDPQHRDEATLFINDWTAQQTAGRIRKILQPDTLDELTRLLLVNVIYFKADWMYPFNPNLTHALPFTLMDGSAIETPMMSQRLALAYMRGNGYQAVALPYQGKQVRMIILLPDSDQFAAIEAQLSPNLQQEIGIRLAIQNDVSLRLPTIQFDSKIDLAKLLPMMGMVDLFIPQQADLMAMAAGEEEKLYVKTATHQAFIAIDEQGTEAAAATAVGVAIISEPPITVIFDHPFLYWIEDVNTGEILFLGRVTDPSQDGGNQ
ncbi:MAG: serpin family protein [Caldilineaceae bacterium]|nr:serpin family protein [Caldilineaceae bacterium]